MAVFVPGDLIELNVDSTRPSGSLVYWNGSEYYHSTLLSYISGTVSLTGSLTASSYIDTPYIRINSTAPSGYLLIGDGTNYLGKSIYGDFGITAAGSGALSLTGVTAGSYGSGILVPVITVDSKGRLTSVSTSTIVPSSLGYISGSGTSGKLAKFSGSRVITDSLISESGTTVSVAGDLSSTSSDTLNTTNGLSIFNSSGFRTLRLTNLGRLVLGDYQTPNAWLNIGDNLVGNSNQAALSISVSGDISTKASTQYITDVNYLSQNSATGSRAIILYNSKLDLHPSSAGQQTGAIDHINLQVTQNSPQTLSTYRGISINSPTGSGSITSITGMRIRSLKTGPASGATTATNLFLEGTDDLTRFDSKLVFNQITNPYGMITIHPASRDMSVTTAQGLGISLPAGTYRNVNTTTGGTVAVGAAFSIGSTTFSASNTMTYTALANLYIAGAPAAGTNATGTSLYSVYVDAGSTRLDGPVFLNVVADSNVTGRQIYWGSNVTTATAAAMGCNGSSGNGLNTGIFFPDRDSVGFTSKGTESARIDSSSRLQIGMTGGTARVNVQGAGATSSTTHLDVYNSSAVLDFSIRGDGAIYNKTLTASGVLVADGSKYIVSAPVTLAELNRLSGVTSSVQTQLDAKVIKAGDTMTGYLTLNAAPTANLHAATKKYVDDLFSSGIKYVEPCLLATTANITLSGNQTIDGFTTTTGIRVLVKNQTTATENGVYSANSGSWTRTTDADVYTEVNNLACLVTSGSTNINRSYVQNNVLTTTLGTENISFVEIARSNVYYADGSTLDLSSNTFSLRSGGITNTHVNSSAAIALSKLASLTASRALVSDASGIITTSSVTSTVLAYIANLTSDVQSQLNNKQGLDSTLTALSAYDTSGLITQTSTDTFTGRAIQGTTDQIVVTNGNGVAGNPVIGTVQDINTTSSPTFAGITINGTTNINGAVLFDTDNFSYDNSNITFGFNQARSGAISSNNALVEITSTGSTSGTPTLILRNSSSTATLIADGAGNLKLPALSSSKVLTLDANSYVVPSNVTTTELSYLYGTTSNIQTQLDNRPTGNGTTSYIAKWSSSSVLTSSLLSETSTEVTVAGSLLISSDLKLGSAGTTDVDILVRGNSTGEQGITWSKDGTASSDKRWSFLNTTDSNLIFRPHDDTGTAISTGSIVVRRTDGYLTLGGSGFVSGCRLHLIDGSINISTGFGIRYNNTATSGQVLIGDGTNFTPKSIYGDFGITAAGSGCLSNTGISAGTYGSTGVALSITVDSKGRITDIVETEDRAVYSNTSISEAGSSSTLVSVDIPAGYSAARIEVIGDSYNGSGGTHEGYVLAFYQSSTNRVLSIIDINHSTGANQGFSVSYSSSQIVIANKASLTNNQSCDVFITFIR